MVPVLRFGAFELDTRASELRRAGRPIKLPPQPLKVLALLAFAAGELVTREEIQQQLWQGETFVDFEQGLNRCVKQLRSALGDNADAPRYIETLPRRGYRFIAPVEQSFAERPVAPIARRATAAGAPPQLMANEGSRTGHVPAPIMLPQPVPGRPEIVSFPERPRQAGASRLKIALLAATLAVVGFVAYLWRPSPSAPRLLRTFQITHSGRATEKMVTDGTRIYFVERVGGHYGLAQVGLQGGESSPIPTPFPNTSLQDISPDGASLLLSSYTGAEPERPLWTMPAAGGSPRRLGSIVGHDATWSPDGRWLAYVNNSELFVAGSDGAQPRKLLSPASVLAYPCWSPDSHRLRFTLRTPEASFQSVWEIAADGSHLRPVFTASNRFLVAGLGGWTPDSRYFFFGAQEQGASSIWVSCDRAGFWHRCGRQPVPLTAGPVSFWGELADKRARRVFAFGLRRTEEMMRLDPESRRLLPVAASSFPFGSVYSRDKRWVVYSTPEQDLWRARADGSDRLQLTFPPLKAAYYSLSPDATRVALQGTTPGGTDSIYLVALDGGNPERLLHEGSPEIYPTWSADSQYIAFGRPPGSGRPEASMPKAIEVVEVKSRKVTELPGSEGLTGPRWSPDGRYIAARSLDVRRILLFDRSTEQWSKLAERDGTHALGWSPDSRFLYFQDFTGEDTPILRVRISDHKLERLIGATETRRSNQADVMLSDTVDPDGFPLLVLKHSTSDIYALDLDLP